MITVANRIFVNPTHAELFETNFHSRARLVDKMKGFISNQLLRPVRVDDPYIVLTRWESKADFEAWMQSEAFTKGHARMNTYPSDMFTRPSQYELHEVISDTTLEQPVLN